MKEEGKSNQINFLLLILILILCFCSDIVRIIIFFCFIIINTLKKGKIIIPKNCHLMCFVFISILGVITGIYNYGVHIRDIIRFLSYMLSPVIYIYTGYILFDEKNDFQFQKTFFLASIINIIQAFIALIFNINSFGFSFDVLRKTKESINFLLLINFYLYILKDKDKHFFGKKSDFLIFTLSLILLIITFSRTNLINLAIGAFIFFILFFKNRKIIKKILMIVICIIIIFSLACLNNNIQVLVKDYIAKISSSIIEMSAERDSWDFKNINNSWRGFEIFSEMNQFKQSNLINKIFGTGYKGVYVGEYANLVINQENDGYLPILHNGFIGVLSYSGIVGVLCYIVFFLKIGFYFFKQYRQTKNRMFILALIIVTESFASTFIISGMMGLTIKVAFEGIIIGYVKRQYTT